jgi:hypothetical protein
MVNFCPRRIDRRNHGTPILFDREIDEYAQTILADYRPELLQEPGIINFQHFLESYLDLQIDFHDIYSEDPNHPILALTAFRSGTIKVFDRESQSVQQIHVPGRTVIIDNAVMEPGREGLALFSGMHEGGHVMMHWPVYTGEVQSLVVCCCRGPNLEK